MLDNPIHTESQRQDPLWPGQPTRPLDQAPTQCGQALEFPQRRALFSGSTLFVADLHLKLAAQVVREDHGQQIGLIAEELAHRDVVHLPLGFQLSEDGLLGTAAFVERHDLASRDRLVGHHRLEGVALDLGDEEVQLQRPFALGRLQSADGEESGAPLPAFWLPLQLEVAGLGVDSPPPAPRFDALLQRRQTLEGHGDGEFDTFLDQHRDERVAEESPVHPDLDRGSRQGVANLAQASLDEILRAVGIMDVAGSVVKVEDLSGLGDGAEERIVAPLALLAAVEADGCSLGPAAGPEDRSVEVEGDSTELESRQALTHEIPAELAQSIDAVLLDLRQSPTDGGDIGQSAQAQQAQNHRIVPIEGHFAQLTVAQQDMNDQAEHEKSAIVNRRVIPGKTGPETLAQVELLEQGLKEHEPAVGAELLVGESESRKSASAKLNLLSGKLHVGGPLGFVCGFCVSQIIPRRGRLLAFWDLQNWCQFNLTVGGVEKTAPFSAKPLHCLYLRDFERFFYATTRLTYLCANARKARRRRIHEELLAL